MPKKKPSAKVLRDNAEEMFKILERLVRNNKEDLELGDYLSQIEDIEVAAWSLLQSIKEQES